MGAITELYDVIEERRKNFSENSYTCYLFSQGLDKILKKCGEECAEVIIAAKNGEKSATVGEISDLAYHVLVLCAEAGITPADIGAELERRAEKIGNRKITHATDHNT